MEEFANSTKLIGNSHEIYTTVPYQHMNDIPRPTVSFYSSMGQEYGHLNLEKLKMVHLIKRKNWTCPPIHLFKEIFHDFSSKSEIAIAQYYQPHNLQFHKCH